MDKDWVSNSEWIKPDGETNHYTDYHETERQAQSVCDILLKDYSRTPCPIRGICINAYVSTLNLSNRRNKMQKRMTKTEQSKAQDLQERKVSFEYGRIEIGQRVGIFTSFEDHKPCTCRNVYKVIRNKNGKLVLKFLRELKPEGGEGE